MPVSQITLRSKRGKMETARVTVFALLFAMASSVVVPKKQLSNGREMPAIALGTYLGFEQNSIVKSKNKEVREVVSKAIDVGWRHIDTASIYTTEDEIGEGVRRKIDEGVVTRDDIFITTKVSATAAVDARMLWNTHHKREQVAEALRESLKKLGLNYVDLYLMHWPVGLKEDYSFSNVDFMETWRGLEDMVKLGLTKSIGVSNFNRTQLKRVLTEATIKPVALQIEIHPQIVQSELVNFAQSQGLVVMGYSPLGSLVTRYGLQFPGPKLDEPAFVEIAKKYGKTTPQVIFRWLVDRNIVPVVKTTNLKRLEENIDVFDFHLEPSEIETINSYNTNKRYTLPTFWKNHIYYPFEKDDSPIEDPFKKKLEEEVVEEKKNN